MGDQRRRNVDWNVAEEDGKIPTWDRVGIAVLMDIRDELQQLNAVFACHRFLNVPNDLAAMAKASKRANRLAAKRAAAKRKKR